MRLLAFFLALESVATFSGGARPPTGVSSTSSSSDSSNARLDRLEIAAVPRATPKKESTPEPLPLWGLPTPPEQRGPSVFKLNQGRAIDVLRHDYPRLFTERPDMSIFTDNIELHDPSGKRLAGKKQYERVFDALRFLRRTTMQDAQVGIRLVADDKSVRAVTLASEAPSPPLPTPLPGVSSLASRFPRPAVAAPLNADPRALECQALDARPGHWPHDPRQRRARARAHRRRVHLRP